MPPRKQHRQKRTIRFTSGDIDRMILFYPDMPYNAVVRRIVNQHLNALEARLDKRYKPVLPTPEEKS